MEIINIEARAFREMMRRFEEFVARIESLCDARCEKLLGKWLDNQDVCQILNTGKRTLQSYRDNGTLAYTRIENKIYYRPTDVEHAIKRITQKQIDKK